MTRPLSRFSTDANYRAYLLEIGKRIKLQRVVTGMNSGELAKKAKMSASYLSQIESGKRAPSLESLYMLCTALNIKISQLFTEIRI